MFVEYPKALYLRGWDDLDACVTVHSAAEEVAARAKGYRGINEPAPEAPQKAAEGGEGEGQGDNTPEAPKRRGRPPKAEIE